MGLIGADALGLPAELTSVFRAEWQSVVQHNAAKILFVEGFNSSQQDLLLSELALADTSPDPIVLRHTYTATEFTPYSGILDIIECLFSLHKTAIDWSELDIFADHKEALSSWLETGVATRVESPYFAYRRFEWNEWAVSLAKLLDYLSLGRPPIMMFAYNLHFATPSTWQALLKITQNIEHCQILIFASVERSNSFGHALRNERWQDFIADAEEIFGVVALKTQMSNHQIQSHALVPMNSIEEWCKSAWNMLAWDDVRVATDVVMESSHNLSVDQFATALLYRIDAEQFSEQWQMANDFCFKLVELANEHKRLDWLGRAYQRLCLLYAYRTDQKNAWHYGRNALSLAIKNGATLDQVESAFSLYIAQTLGNGEFRVDSTNFIQMLDSAHELNHANRIAMIYSNAHYDYEAYGTLQDGINKTRKAVEIYKQRGHKSALAHAYQQLGIAYSYNNDHENHIASLKQSLRIREELGDMLHLIRIYNGIGHAYLLKEDYQRAFDYFHRALELVAGISRYNEIMSTLYNIGNLFFISRNFQIAGVIFKRILKVMEILKADYIPFHSVTKIYAMLGICFFKQSAFVKALSIADKIEGRDLHAVRGTGETSFYVSLFNGMIAAYSQNFDLADEFFLSAPAALDINIRSTRRLLPSYYGEFGLALRDAGFADRAELCFHTGVQVSEELGYTRHSAWLELLLTGKSDEDTLLTLPHVNVDVRYIEELAKHQASLNQLNSSLKELNFINQVETLIVDATNQDQILDSFLELVALSFGIDIINFSIERYSAPVVNHHYPKSAPNLVNMKRLEQYILAHSEGSTGKPITIVGPEPVKSLTCIPLYSENFRSKLIVMSMTQEVGITEGDIETLSLVTRQICRAIEKLSQAKQLSQKNLDLQNALIELDEKHEELKQLQTQLIQTEKLTSLGTLVAGLAHELNNPVNFVLTGSENAIEAIVKLNTQISSLLEAEDDEVTSWLTEQFGEIEIQHSAVLDGAKRIAGVVEDLRQFASLDKAEWQPKVAVDDDVAAAVRLVQSQYADHVNFELVLNTNVMLPCWPAKLNQAVLNAIRNAYEAITCSPTHVSGSGLIKITSEIVEKWYVLKITDNGCGLRHGIENKVFEPFYTTKTVGMGYGLGLSIAYSVVQKHRGEVSLCGNADGGATLEIKLPLVTDPEL